MGKQIRIIDVINNLIKIKKKLNKTIIIRSKRLV